MPSRAEGAGGSGRGGDATPLSRGGSSLKLVSLAAIALGVGGALLCFLLWAGNGLPYQDPTPQMLKAQEFRSGLYAAGMLLGFLAATMGCAGLWLVGRRVRRPPV